MPVKTNYLGVHDAKYRKLKDAGEPGWNSIVLAGDSFRKVMASLSDRGIASGRLLELGCGVGDLSQMLAEAGFTVSGIDISPNAVNWANEKMERLGIEIDYRVGNVVDLPYEPAHFDVVVDALCFHCIIGNDRPLFLQSVRRVLKTGGLFIVMTKCGEPTDPGYPFDPVSRCRIENGIATRYWGLPETLTDEIASAGFRILESQVYHEFSQPLYYAVTTTP